MSEYRSSLSTGKKEEGTRSRQALSQLCLLPKGEAKWQGVWRPAAIEIHPSVQSLNCKLHTGDFSSLLRFHRQIAERGCQLQAHPVLEEERGSLQLDLELHPTGCC